MLVTSGCEGLRRRRFRARRLLCSLPSPGGDRTRHKIVFSISFVNTNLLTCVPPAHRILTVKKSQFEKELRKLFSKFGSRGGKARAKKMSAAQRKASATKAAKARWAKRRKA